MNIKFNNYAKKIGIEKSGYDWYKWEVFVDEPDETLDKIEYVKYLLHPTFPNPERIVTDRSTKFALESSGWGVFKIIITIKFKNGTTQETTYDLSFNKDWP